MDSAKSIDLVIRGHILVALAHPSKLYDKRKGNGKTGATANLPSKVYITASHPVQPPDPALNTSFLVIGNYVTTSRSNISLFAVKIDDQTRPLRRHLCQTRLPIHTVTGFRTCMCVCTVPEKSTQEFRQHTVFCFAYCKQAYTPLSPPLIESKHILSVAASHHSN